MLAEREGSPILGYPVNSRRVDFGIRNCTVFLAQLTLAIKGSESEYAYTFMPLQMCRIAINPSPPNEEAAHRYAHTVAALLHCVSELALAQLPLPQRPSEFHNRSS